MHARGSGRVICGGWFAMIGGKQPKHTTFNRQQFLWFAQGLDGFKCLVSDIGSSNAGSIANLIYDSQIKKTNPTDRYIQIAAGGRVQYNDLIDNLFLTEFSQIREQRAHAAALLEMATGGRLHKALIATTEPESEYFQSKNSSADGTPEREIAKACGWVSNSMHGDTRHLAQEILTQHVLTAPSRPALGLSAQTLDQVHAVLVPDAPRFRSPNNGVAYPSSIGGRFLLEQIFQWTATADWPPPGDDLWMDIALFYLGAVASVQGYTDGNKRAARMGYAITLLKANRPFIAPGQVLEKALICMHRADQP
jgi:hypothetical protein